jgi:hypothetical protein
MPADHSTGTSYQYGRLVGIHYRVENYNLNSNIQIAQLLPIPYRDGHFTGLSLIFDLQLSYYKKIKSE